MSLDIGAAVRNGLRRTVERNGLALVGAFVALGFANLLVRQSFLASYFALVERQATTLPPDFPPPTPLSLPISLAAAVLLGLALAFVAEWLRIVAIRTFASERIDTVPGEFLTRNAGFAVLNGVVGGIVVSVLVAIGILLLVIPGIFLAVVFFFVRQEIAVQDANFVEAMERSWELTEGNRVEVFVLGLALVVLVIGTPIVSTSILAAVLGDASPVPPVVGLLLSAPVAAFGVASVSRAYVQLTGADAGEAVDDEDEWDDPPGVDL